MAGRRTRQQEYEEREIGSRTPLMVLGAILMFGIAALLFYAKDPAYPAGMPDLIISFALCGSDALSFLCPLPAGQCCSDA